MFEIARNLFSAYCTQLKTGGVIHAGHAEYQSEIAYRLGHMNFILARIKHLTVRTAQSDQAAQLQYDSYLTAVPPAALQTSAEGLAGYCEHLKLTMPLILHEVEIGVLTEAFYYCAARVLNVLTRVKPFPGLGSFKADGVRDVRNKLLEHPEGSDSTVIEVSSSFDFSSGPVIKGVRVASKVSVFPDKGLYINAGEFAHNLEAKLRALIK